MHRTHLHRTRNTARAQQPDYPAPTLQHARTCTPASPPAALHTQARGAVAIPKQCNATRTHKSTYAPAHPHTHAPCAASAAKRQAHARTHVCNHTPSKEIPEIPASVCSCLAQALTPQPKSLLLNSVSGLVSKVWYRIPFDQSELSISKIPPTDSPTVRPGRHPRVNRPSISRR